MTAEADELRARLLETANLVGTARNLIAEGGVVDLQGLDDRVASICAALPKLPPDEREALKPALIALMDGLGGLADTVKAQHALLADKLSTVSQGSRAAGAYGAGSATAKPRRKR
jgi:hypothetical protein